MKRCGYILLAAGLSIGVAPAARANEQVYQKVLPGTVWVLTSVGSERGSFGSGALIDLNNKWVVTNYHVVEDKAEVVVCFPTAVDGQVVSQRAYYLSNLKDLGIRGRVILRDARRDLALIALDRLPAGAQAVPLAARSVSPGQHVQSIGNPGQSPALWVYTSGTVRQVVADRWQAMGHGRQFSFDAWVVLTQSAVNPGDSGSPVVNDRGELVAVVSGTGPGQQNSTCIDIREVRALLAAAAIGGTPEASSTRSGQTAPAGAFAEEQVSSARSPEAVGGDPRVRRALEQATLLYRVQPDGSFRVPFALPGGAMQNVIVADRSERFQQTEYRRVWAQALVLNAPPSGELTAHLLRPTESVQFGGWELRQEQGRYTVVFCLRVAADADGRALLTAVTRVQDEVIALRQQSVASNPAGSN
jgi:S1-C subfamily serine protease